MPDRTRNRITWELSWDAPPMTLSRDVAVEVALRWMADEWRPNWEPAIAHVEDADGKWRVFYNSRAFVETRAIEHALAGNLPLLVDKESGEVTMDLAYSTTGQSTKRP